MGRHHTPARTGAQQDRLPRTRTSACTHTHPSPGPHLHPPRRPVNAAPPSSQSPPWPRAAPALARAVAAPGGVPSDTPWFFRPHAPSHAHVGLSPQEGAAAAGLPLACFRPQCALRTCLSRQGLGCGAVHLTALFQHHIFVSRPPGASRLRMDRGGFSHAHPGRHLPHTGPCNALWSSVLARHDGVSGPCARARARPLPCVSLAFAPRAASSRHTQAPRRC